MSSSTGGADNTDDDDDDDTDVGADTLLFRLRLRV